VRGFFTQSDVVRALKAASKAGLSVERFEISRDGKIIVVANLAKSSEPLVDDLDRELLDFEARHGEG
jgi:hypothetical protein